MLLALILLFVLPKRHKKTEPSGEPGAPIEEGGSRPDLLSVGELFTLDSINNPNTKASDVDLETGFPYPTGDMTIRRHRLVQNMEVSGERDRLNLDSGCGLNDVLKIVNPAELFYINGYNENIRRVGFTNVKDPNHIIPFPYAN